MRNWKGGLGVRKLTTDDPKGTTEWMLNIAFVNNGEVYLRGIGEDCDISLVEYCRNECKTRCEVDLSDVPTEQFAEYMECHCPVSILYFLAVGAAENRERLKEYENTNADPYGEPLK
jgi:hypothetical protein